MSDHDQIVQFAASNGESFVYLDSFPRNDMLLYSPDGKTFYGLQVVGFGGGSTEHKLSFEDPHHGTSGKLYRDGNAIMVNDQQYLRQEMTTYDPSKLVLLPTIRRVEYFCQTEDGTIIYVSADKYRYSYESFRLFVGDGATMREIKIDHVMRYRDGGTTFIRTSEDKTFFSPAPSRTTSAKTPTWDGYSLMVLDPADYDIVETPEGEVRITKR